MKSIEIIEKDGALIIKKRLEAWFLIFLIAATVAMPILAHRYLGDVIAVIDAVFMLMWTVSYAARPHLDRIIIDKSARVISFGNKKYSFDELSDIYYWAVERNDPERDDTFRVIFQFKDGRKRFIKTDSKKQMQELIDTVKSIVGLN
jgi:hypothetical protein